MTFGIIYGTIYVLLQIRINVENNSGVKCVMERFLVRYFLSIKSLTQTLLTTITVYLII